MTSHMTSKQSVNNTFVKKIRYYCVAFFHKTRLLLSCIFSKFFPCRSFQRRIDNSSGKSVILLSACKKLLEVDRVDALLGRQYLR